MIRNIVFDMGQVLIHFRPGAFIDRLGVSEEEKDLLLREVFYTVEWAQLDRGSITEEAAAQAMCARLPERLHDHARALVFDWWKRPLFPVEGMAELIAELKGLGYGVYLLSNASIRLREYFSRVPGSQYFDGLIVSAEWLQLKPEREIFQTLFREFGLRPEECFFVDDLPANVEGARFAGMDGAVFRGDIARLRRELNDAGVPVAARPAALMEG